MNNNNKKNIVIVGAGITGCMAAIYAAKRGFKVSIYDKSKIIGGVLNDIVVDKNIFLNGCQYLDRNTIWFKDILNFLNTNDILDNFLVKYYSYSNLTGEEKIFEDEYPELVFDKKFKKYKLKVKKKRSLKDQILCYPLAISKKIDYWFKRFKVNPRLLEWGSGSNGLMLSRVYLRKNITEILEYKKNNKLANELYGVPKKTLKKNSSSASLPKYGYNKFFDELKKKMIKRNIIIKNLTPIAPRWNSNKLELISRGKKIETDYIVWTANPTGLIKSYGLSKLESVNFKMRVLCFNLKNKINENFYIQIYSKNSSIVRIFAYSILGKPKITLECFDEKESIDNIISFSNKLLKKKGLDNKILDNQCISDTSQIRYSLTSIKDRSILNKFRKATKDTNLIDGFWDLYSRNDKIIKVRQQIINL